MPFPFPGMDPYLEHPSIWPDVHFELIRGIRAALAPQVAPDYYVAVEERTYLVASLPETYLGRPDVAVVREADDSSASTESATSAALAKRPIVVELPSEDEVRERYLEIRDAESHKVITVIEILSPTNKLPGEGREQYERKRRQVLRSLSNLVEFDLLRAGEPMLMSPRPDSHYHGLVSREWERFKAQLYRFNLADPIPSILVPLRRGEDEPDLDLGTLLAQIYDQVRYDLRLNYSKDPVPSFADADLAWAASLLSKAGKR